MSGRAAGWLLLAALAGGAGWWAWSSRTVAEDARLDQARAGALEAEALSDEGRHDEAADRYLAAAELAAAAGDAGLARGLRSQAAVPLKLAGRIDEARAILLPVLEEARASDDRRVEGLALGNLARVEDLAGNGELALAYMDELADFAQREGDKRLEVWTLEQAAATAGARGDVTGAIARIERALQRDDALSDEERRHDALLGQKALLLAQSGDTEGAWTLWAALPVSAATLANRAVSLARWDLHEQASDIAWSAAQAFGEEGDARRAQRDQALLLHVSELIANGQADHAEDRIQALVDVGGDDPALDPFRMQRARVMLARGRFAEAVDALSALVSGPAAAAPRLGELTSVALLLDDRPAEALERIESLDDDLGRRLLRSWALLLDPPGDALISEAEPGLRAAAWTPDDTGLERLRSASPVALPSPAWLALEIGLSDASRARASGNTDLSTLLLRDAVREALLWQALDAMAGVPGLPISDDARGVQRKLVEAWIEGRMPEDQAILAVVGGGTGSYLILMRPGVGPTTWSLAPKHVLEEQAGRVIDALHGPDVAAIARASYRLYSALVPRGAREDLAGATQWTMILPPELAHVPPGLLVTEDPGAEGAFDETKIAWLVLDRSASLLPHVPGPPAPGAAEGATWLSVGAPAIELEGLPLSSSMWLARYGLNVFNAGPPQAVGDGPLLVGADATVPMLRRELPGRAGVRLSLPGAGCGQLGGLAFAPTRDASRGDEAGGLLTFSRMHTLPLPPLVIMDSTRFDPADVRYGPNWAATSVLVRAHALLLTRWPVVIALRDAVVERVLEARAQGRSLGVALAGVQRDYLETARATGDRAAMHPQLWGAWLPYGLD